MQELEPNQWNISRITEAKCLELVVRWMLTGALFSLEVDYCFDLFFVFCTVGLV
jgi:hypothetical protein